MNTNTLTAQNCSLFEIDAELESAFDQLQEEPEITGNISKEARERCLQLFAELGRRSIASRHTCEHSSATTMTGSFREYWTSPNWIWKQPQRTFEDSRRDFSKACSQHQFLLQLLYDQLRKVVNNFFG